MFDNVESFHRPTSIREALRLLQSGKGQARVVAGGTDVVVEADRSTRILIDLTRTGLDYIRRGTRTTVIGATATMVALERSPHIRALAGGLLAHAAATCGSPQIRNLATIGGNISSASPAAEVPAALAALDAVVSVATSAGRRRLPLLQYLAGARAGDFRRAILVEIVIPDPPRSKRAAWSFQKFGRTAVDISIVNAAAGLQIAANGRVKWARIALGAVGPTPLRIPAAEVLLTGRILDQTALAEACAEVERDISPISDQRASAGYRRELSRVLASRAIEDCAEKIGWRI